MFEVLDAQRELVNGEVALARAEHDHVASGYALLAATGRLTALYLNLPVDYPNLDDAVRKKRRYADDGTVDKKSTYPRLLGPAPKLAEDRVDMWVIKPSSTREPIQVRLITSVNDAPAWVTSVNDAPALPEASSVSIHEMN